MPLQDDTAFAPQAPRAPAPSRGGRWQLPELVTAADAAAPRAERNLWLLHALRWMAHDAPARNAQGTPLAVLRLRQAVALLERDPALAAEVGLLLHRLWFEADAAALFADFGFTPRRGFVAALGSRLLRRWLPPSPDTPDGAALFGLATDTMADAAWLAEIDAETLQLLCALVARAAPPGEAPDPLAPPAQALRWLAATTHAAALAPALRSRLAPAAMAARPFEQLAGAVESLLDTRAAGPAQAANYLRALLQHCRDAAAGVQEHLREHGVSADLVIEQEQLQLRLDRMEALTDVLVAPQPAAEGARLLARLAAAQREERGVRAQLAWQHRLLARKLSERHALAGEHYVARDGAEYRQMLGQAAGGGAVVAFTTLAKFGLLALGLAPFWSGMAAGLNYAGSFLLIYLLHGSLATKQPAMTAAALAARAGEMQAAHGSGSVRAAEGFVDEIAALMRSQLASVIGNLGLVVPVMAGLQGLAWWWAGRPLIGEETAHHVLASLSLLGPTPLYAAFTGVLLFAGSVAGGWVENAFAYHQTAGALAHHPRLVARLGAARAQRWAQWWRLHINGLASNAALGLLLGLVPVLLAFVGLPLDVRHVTLATGQLTAAVATLGWDTLATPAFGWCVAGIAATAALNLGVSFVLALRLALRARRIAVGDRRRLRQALLRRLRRRPLEFLLPRPLTARDAAAQR